MKNKISPGVGFLVPLGAVGFARGVVARSAPNKRILAGYFFGPIVRSANVNDFNDLNPSHAIFIGRFGSLSLIDGKWPIVGMISNWEQRDWPFTRAIRINPLVADSLTIVEYDPRNPAVVLNERITRVWEDLPLDGLAGAGYIESTLTQKLGDR